jgi:hypothetical protein
MSDLQAGWYVLRSGDRHILGEATASLLTPAPGRVTWLVDGREAHVVAGPFTPQRIADLAAENARLRKCGNALVSSGGCDCVLCELDWAKAVEAWRELDREAERSTEDAPRPALHCELGCVSRPDGSVICHCGRPFKNFGEWQAHKPPKQEPRAEDARP